ncbi:MAG: NAD(P)/FAD-dependent oxidoreductase, partial [Chloroflexi bacterium]|nr:NAD(P)/FAD-dependent oxidoreductase [Chloroflexota bacterium]
NGLVAAGYLARAGLKVVVLERRAFVGGACITEELWPGVRAPTCSYICHMLQRKVIDDLELRRHGLHIYPQDPHVLQPFPSGHSALIWDSDERTVDSIAGLNSHDARSFPAFQDFRRRVARLLLPHFLSKPPSMKELFDQADAAGETALLERLLVGNTIDVVDEYFESPEVKALFVRAWDAGDPTAPGSLFSTAYLWTDLFTPYEDYGIVRGGMGGITQALARSAESAGATIRTDAEVERILIENGRARGATLRGGEEVTAATVVSNADPKRTFLKLVASDALDPRFRRRVERIRTNAAYLKFHAALDGLPDFSAFLGPEHDPRWLAYTQIGPSVEYYRQSWNDAVAGRPSSTPVMSVQIPTVYDSSLAPPGTHVMSIWVQYAPVHADWEHLREPTGQHLIDTLATYAGDVQQRIREWMLLTPPDIEARVGLTDGNIRHVDMVLGQMLSDRPLAGWSDYHTPIDGLYLCGAGTHPGGEVTGAPGHNAAAAILHDLDVAATA